MNLRDIRERKGLKITELSTKMGVQANTISRWERGQREPDLNALRNLAQILNCSIDDLIANPPIPSSRAVEAGEKVS